MCEHSSLSKRLSALHHARSRLYSAYAWAVFVLCLTAFGSVAILVRRPEWAHRVLRAGSRTVLWLGGITWTVTGLERLPSGPHVLLVNHTSFVDPLVLMAGLPPGYTFTVRQEFTSQACFYPLLKSIGTIILKRHDQAQVVPNLTLLVDALQSGKKLLIFPEGGFWPQPGLHPFHSGAFVAAQFSNAPIVLAALSGAQTVLRPRTWAPRRAAIQLEIGARLDSQNQQGGNVEQMMQRAYTEMASMLKE